MSGVEACYIRLQRDRVKKHQRTIVDQLITKSRYPAMDRNERRTFEYYADEIAQLKAQQKDLKKAKTVAQRIGVILERTRKELQAIKQHLSDYNFVSTDGSDMKNGDGNYSEYEQVCRLGNDDMTMDSSTRHAWIEQAKNMLTCLRNFSLAQRLGNYSLLWNPQDNFVTSVIDKANFDPCGQGVSAHLQYRPEFLYMQYNTTCRTAPKKAEEELDSDKTSSGDIPLDQGTSKKYHNYFSISNPDLAISDMWKQLVCNVVDNTGSSDDGPDGEPDATTPSVYLENIDDERDVSCVLEVIIDKLDEVMHAQQDNDNEQSALCCAQEVSQQNLCWFESICAEMSEIDEDELKSKHASGEALLGDLTDLFRKSSSKKDYFNCVEITSTGASWY